MTSQIVVDFEKVETVLTHALMWPQKSSLGDKEYNIAHAEIQQAMAALKRIKKIKADNNATTEH